MKGRRYATLDEIKTASKEELKKIFENDFLKCFEDWKNRWHKCITSHGDYFEGYKIGSTKYFHFGPSTYTLHYADPHPPILTNSLKPKYDVVCEQKEMYISIIRKECGTVSKAFLTSTKKAYNFLLLRLSVICISEVFWIVFDFYLLKKMDQSTCIKFCVKNEIKCADAFRMLTVAYGEATLDRSNFYRWYKMFSEGREDVNDEERAGCPSTSTTDEKINEVEKIISAIR
ncbi:hypothetical protein LAZ67_9001508 [Cordylochernes scorpioides]|uniref:Mos1 transposase HTH domain-containing protein n=1 Tax=Cordylochernes scorpioides TaxID=51811 RepID=A0ABY6KTQ1_9ARAC|nr:hypothetical protein LAZ67_9001508 [Cordylochernes scorpioides]